MSPSAAPARPPPAPWPRSDHGLSSTHTFFRYGHLRVGLLTQARVPARRKRWRGRRSHEWPREDAERVRSLSIATWLHHREMGDELRCGHPFVSHWPSRPAATPRTQVILRGRGAANAGRELGWVGVTDWWRRNLRGRLAAPRTSLPLWQGISGQLMKLETHLGPSLWPTLAVGTSLGLERTSPWCWGCGGQCGF